MKIIAVIPCLNEAAYIGDVVGKAIKYVDCVLVIDDGSNDDTSEVARRAGAEVIRHDKRRGAGAATRSPRRWPMVKNSTPSCWPSTRPC